jgi:hypothetical protein
VSIKNGGISEPVAEKIISSNVTAKVPLITLPPAASNAISSNVIDNTPV